MTQLLRVVFAGSVDDGKSTLIGRLLHDSGGVYEDQLRGAHNRDGLQLAFVTDGLQAEREQGITIDVAYRYFSTSRRKFIIVDAPGHQEFTRNMVTRSSMAQAAVILIDPALNVPLLQTVRHAAIARLLGIKHIVFAINKMDLLDMRQDAFEEIRQKCRGLAVDFLPVSALLGDNVVRRSERLAWFQGPTLLEYLETVKVEAECESAPFRFPVAQAVRPVSVSPADTGLKACATYLGQIASGSVAVGDEVMVLPSRRRARVQALPAYAITLDAGEGIGRGDMLVDPNQPPAAVRKIRADVVWLGDTPLTAGRRVIVKHTTQEVCAEVTRGELATNDIGSVIIETQRPLFCDTYNVNRRTGGFIMIDPTTSQTLAAGMIRESFENAAPGTVIWLTGLSSAGKTTLGHALHERLWARGLRVELLDGDEIRRELWPDLGFSKQDRDENVRRLGFLAAMLAASGVIVLVAAISPYREARQEARKRVGKFIEVYVNASLETCQQRDVKG